MSPTDAEDKPALRRAALERRSALTAENRRTASDRIAEGLCVAIGELAPASVALYLPLDSEVDMRPVMAWAFATGLEVLLPAMEGEHAMVFRPYRRDGDLSDGGFGTKAPPREAGTADPDIIVTPLLAFDRQGGRLGRGRGFYDRTLGQLRARRPNLPVLAGAFSIQEFDRVPMEAHDIYLDIVVTERETVDCRAAGN